MKRCGGRVDWVDRIRDGSEECLCVCKIVVASPCSTCTFVEVEVGIGTQMDCHIPRLQATQHVGGRGAWECAVSTLPRV